MKPCILMLSSACFTCFLCLATYSDAVRVKYSRAYYGRDLGVAREYQARYSLVARLSGYVKLDQWTSFYHCGNFEANELGDYMGFFSCNMYFEPYNFDYCCGLQGSHYCCPNSSLATPYRSDPDTDSNASILSTGIGIGIFVAIVCIVVVLMRVFFYCHLFSRRATETRFSRSSGQASEVAVVTTISSNYRQQPNQGFQRGEIGFNNPSFAMTTDTFEPPPYPGPEVLPPSYDSVTDGNQPPVPGNQPPPYTCYPIKET